MVFIGIVLVEPRRVNVRSSGGCGFAGIPAPEVLRMATLTSAEVMGANKDRGVIAAGKLADMILIDGDPTKNIRDLDKVTTVIKDGNVYDPIAIEKALGIAPP